MVVKSVRVENVQKIRVAKVSPDRHFQIVSGLNGEGKTSLIQAVHFALAGKRSHPKRIIREGEDEGIVCLDVGDWLIELELEEGSAPKLTLTRKDTGQRVAKPQETINEWLGDLSFDPLAFSRMASAQQRKVLLDVVDLGEFDLDENEKQYDATFELRKAVNRSKRDIEGDIKENYPPGESFADLPDEKVKIAEAISALQTANAEVAENDAERRADARVQELTEEGHVHLADAWRKIYEKRAELARDQDLVEGTSAAQIELEEAAKESGRLAQDLIDPDVAALEKDVERVEEINTRIDERERRNVAVARLGETIRDSEHYTVQLETLLTARKSALANAKWPIDGLGVRKDDVIFQGRPFGQACASEQLGTSVAIGMALNPTLCIMFIQDGSLLDDDHMAMLKGLAEANEFQLWVEVVSAKPLPGSIHIRDGSVVTEDGAVGEPAEVGTAQPVGVTTDGE